MKLPTACVTALSSTVLIVETVAPPLSSQHSVDRGDGCATFVISALLNGKSTIQDHCDQVMDLARKRGVKNDAAAVVAPAARACEPAKTVNGETTTDSDACDCDDDIISVHRDDCDSEDEPALDCSDDSDNDFNFKEVQCCCHGSDCHHSSPFSLWAFLLQSVLRVSTIAGIDHANPHVVIQQQQVCTNACMQCVT
jgi:hypothetical protein